MHPADAIRGSRSRKLQGRTIVLAVCGSIAAVEAVKLARELIRHGAHVVPVMSDGAQAILHPNALEFACGRRPITELTGAVEHVDLCGERPAAHLLLIAPATANTISKVAMGVDDTPVTTFATAALGSGLPIILAPAMDASMWAHPFVRENLERLKGRGVEVVEPLEEEDKAKLADPEEIAVRVIRRLGPRELSGHRVLIIGGATAEPIDEIRVVTNRSTGETAVELARVAFELGGEVELWLGRAEVAAPPFIHTLRFGTTAELASLANKAEGDFCLVPAAISDFGPAAQAGKIPSDVGHLTLDLRSTPKLLPILRRRVKGALVGFKAEAGVGKEELRARALALVAKDNLDFVVANDVERVGKGRTSVLVLDREGRSVEIEGPKSLVAEGIWGAVLHGVKG